MRTDIPEVASRSLQIWNERTSLLSKHIPEIESSGLSVVGPVREDNQDSIHLPDLENPVNRGPHDAAQKRPHTACRSSRDIDARPRGASVSW